MEVFYFNRIIKLTDTLSFFPVFFSTDVHQGHSACVLGTHDLRMRKISQVIDFSSQICVLSPMRVEPHTQLTVCD